MHQNTMQGSHIEQPAGLSSRDTIHLLPSLQIKSLAAKTDTGIAVVLQHAHACVIALLARQAAPTNKLGEIRCCFCFGWQANLPDSQPLRPQ